MTKHLPFTKKQFLCQDTASLSDDVRSFNNALDTGNIKPSENSTTIAEIISLIAKVDLNSTEGKANITSISDNNGKRIIL